MDFHPVVVHPGVAVNPQFPAAGPALPLNDYAIFTRARRVWDNDVVFYRAQWPIWIENIVDGAVVYAPPARMVHFKVNFPFGANAAGAMGGQVPHFDMDFGLYNGGNLQVTTRQDLLRNMAQSAISSLIFSAYWYLHSFQLQGPIAHNPYNFHPTNLTLYVYRRHAHEANVEFRGYFTTYVPNCPDNFRFTMFDSPQFWMRVVTPVFERLEAWFEQHPGYPFDGPGDYLIQAVITGREAYPTAPVGDQFEGGNHPPPDAPDLPGDDDFPPPPPPPQPPRGRRELAGLGIRTQAQIDAVLGQARVSRSGLVVRGIPEKFWNKMFYQDSLDSFFHESKSVFCVPTVGAFCFPMAFLKCQVRQYHFTEGKITHITESKGCESFDEYKEAHPEWIFPIPLENLLLDGNPIYQLESTPFHKGTELALFNGYKERAYCPRGTVQYYKNSPSYTYAMDWYAAAIELHSQAEFTLGQAIDYNDLYLVTQAYAAVFRVNIHVYSLEAGVRRISTSSPPGGSNAHVHMVYNNEHATPITSIRDFFAKDHIRGDMSIHNFCDYCLKANKSSITKPVMYAHVEECRVSNAQFLSANLWQFEKSTRDKLGKSKRFNWNMKDGVSTSQCNCCKEVVKEIQDTGHHQCWMNIPDKKKEWDATKIWVYDVESFHIERFKDNYTHEVCLVCLQNVYTGQRHSFPSVEQFVWFLLSPCMDDTVILAHNGGSYDHQFVLKFCEENTIKHDCIPHPNSQHKYICVNVYRSSSGIENKRMLLDFIAFCPGSLKGIGKAYQLPVSKGDFPHKFHSQANEHYCGSIPSLEYFEIYRKRTVEDAEEVKTWYNEERVKWCECGYPCFLPNCPLCHKPTWNLKIELEKYCWLDVEVLAQSVKLFRESMLQPEIDEDNPQWMFTGIDPFKCFTQSHIAISLLLGGFRQPEKIASTQYYPRCYEGPEAVAWMSYLERTQNIFIHHAGRNMNDYYITLNKVEQPFTGYYNGGTRNKVLYQLLDCKLHGCPTCYANKPYKHPYHIHLTQEKLQEDLYHLYYRLVNKKFKVVQLYLCQYKETIEPRITAYEKEAGNVIKDRECFYGGRTEVFCAFGQVKPADEDEIIYQDVVSMYPYICAHKVLPIGYPTLIFGRDIDLTRCSPHHGDPYWGYIRAKIRPWRDDPLGLLPSRDPITGRLENNLYEKIGVWHTEEIYLALEHHYEIVEVYQVYHWNPSERSSHLLKGYISYFLRMKQEADGWVKAGASSENPSAEEQARVIEDMYQANGRLARMRPEHVRKSPVKRHIAKIFLNCLWGKFVQKSAEMEMVEIFGYHEYTYLMNHKCVQRETLKFRYLSNNWFKVYFQKTSQFIKRNNRYNIFLGAAVPMYGRTMLNREMLKIGPERIWYCDTDSIVARRKKGTFVNGRALGQFANEYPGKVIELFLSLAPKTYYLKFQEVEDKVTYPCLKMKGINLSLENQEKVKLKELMVMLAQHWNEQPVDSIQLKHFSIFTNSTNRNMAYATVLARDNEKALNPVFSKRELLTCKEKKLEDQAFLPLFPRGFLDNKDKQALVTKYFK